MRCPNCGRDNSDGMRFCGYCSAPLEPGEEIRKTVTVLFCDVTGSTSLGETLDPETLRRIMQRYFDAMRAVLESHGGTVEKFIGDAVMAVFGVPLVHEDDALRAVRAAVDMRERLGGLNKELERDHAVTIVARTGVNTGEVVVGTSGQTLATGDAVNVAARLEQAARPGEVLIGADTHRLVRDAVVVERLDALELKGKAQPVGAFRLVSVVGAEGLARRFDVALVGRAAELRVLEEALRRAEADASCVLVTILGTAGVGKSRLVQEFIDREGPAARIVRGRCLPYGEGITYWPVVEMLMAAADIGQFDGPEEMRAKILRLLAGGDDINVVAERLAQLLGVVDAAAAPEETNWAVRKVLESMAASAPLVVVIDDIHWAEPALLDLIEHVAYWSRDSAILLLCDARPELLDRRPGWGGAQLEGISLPLNPLSDVECGELLMNLLDRAELPVAARNKIIDAAEGNPLFVEHMVAMLIDDDFLHKEEGRWVLAGDPSAIAPPRSIMALLDARLERLTAEERAVIERASIEGRTFHVGSVRALGPGDADVSEPIMALIRRDLIRPDRPALAGQDALRFRHILIRDAAYRRIPKQTRAQLHERHAGWLVETAGDRRAEFEEIVAFHLEQAYRLRIELGQQDAETESLATRAAAHFIASGRRAAERGDAVAASNLFGRAADLMPASHPDRPKVLADQCVNLTESGLADRAREAVEQAEAAIEDMSDPSAEIRVRFARLRLDSAMEPEGVATRMRREAERAIPLLEAIGDDAGLAQAWMLAGDAELYWAHDAAMLDAFRRSLQHAERAGDRSATSEAALWCMLGIASGPTPADQGLLAIEAIMESAPDNLELKAWSQIQRGKLLAMLGRADEGRSLVQASRATFEELGRALTFGGSGMETATFEELAGDGDAAERELRSSYETLESLGEKGYLSTAVGRLARYVAIRGDLEEAEVLVSIGREASASEDVYSQVAWRQALALVHARRGELESASALTEEALTLAEDTDDCQLQGELFEDVAEVHRLAGRTGQAAAAIERAVDVWNRKGAVAVVDRLRSRLSELTGGPGS